MMAAMHLVACLAIVSATGPGQVTPAPPAPPAGPDPLALYRAQQKVFHAAADRVAPCVVTIETVGGAQPPARPVATSSPAGRGDRRPPTIRPTGSGFIIADGPTTGLVYSADGLIITSSFNFVRDPSLQIHANPLCLRLSLM